MVLFKFTERSLGLISTVILARLLVPADFGLVAMAMSIIAVLELMSAFSFDVVLIQNQKAERKHYNTAWTFNVLFAVCSSILLVVLAVPAASFYKEPELSSVMYVLAIGYLAAGFTNIGIVAFQKQMEFNKEFSFLLGRKLVAFCVTITLAFTLESYWALVIGMISGKFAGVIFSYIFQSYRPWFSLEARHELFHFSKWLLLNNILIFFKIRFVDFVIGRFSSSRALGLYNVSFEISNLPTTEMVAPINRAVFPGYAKISDNLVSLKQGFIDVMSIIAVTAIPAGVGIATTADFLVVAVLGEKWIEAIPLIKVLAFFGAVTAMSTNVGAVYLALGKPKEMALLSIVHVLLFIPLLIFLTLKYSAIGAAWATLITAVFMLPVYYIATFRHINLTFSEFFKSIWRPIFSVIVMYGVVKYAQYYIVLNSILQNELLILTTLVTLGAFTYGLMLIVLWLLCAKPPGAETHILEKIKSRIRKNLKVDPAGS